MRYLFSILVVFVFTKALVGQFNPIYSTYMLNGFLLNPAYAGSHEALTLSSTYRNQWVGFGEGAPEHITFSTHAPLKKSNVALGLLISNEEIGFTSNTGLYGNYAYRVKLKKGKLAFGLRGGFDLLAYSENDLRLTDHDDSEFGNSSTSLLPNFGAGVYYYGNKFYAGFSIPAFLSRKEASNDNGYEITHNISYYTYLLTSGAVLNLSDNLKIKPSFLIQYNQLSSVFADINLGFIFSDFMMIGASYRTNNTITGIFEIRIRPQLRLGYAYDYSLGNLNVFGNGSHEIVLSYDLAYIIKAANPRYF
jgi:type IX secretion system PorP/SprF family membrane protein